jgi:radical SAM protein with 4Fe4S-binding SPASM domain
MPINLEYGDDRFEDFCPALFNTTITRIGEKVVLENYPLCVRILLNKPSLEVLELCDGHTPVKNIIKLICDRHNLDELEARERIRVFLYKLHNLGFFGDIRNERNLTVEWDITYKCNLRCKHCLVDAGIGLPNELNTDECLEIIDELAKHRFRLIVFSGGEPFIRHDFLRILEYASDKGFIVKILTNATLVTPEIARKLRKCEVMFVQTSLEGANKATHDKIRGEGSFDKAIAGIKNMVAQNVSVGVATVLTSENYLELEELARLCIKMGVKILMPGELLIRGRAESNKLRPPPITDIEREKYIKGLADKYAGEILIKNQIDTTRQLLQLVDKGIVRYACSRIISGIAINPIGEVYPCKGFYGKCDGALATGSVCSLTYGRLPRERLDVILKRRLSVHIPTVEEIDTQCRYKKACLGGCAAETFKRKGTFLSPSPDCDEIRHRFENFEHEGYFSFSEEPGYPNARKDDESPH